MSQKTTIAINDSGLTPESPGTPAVATRTFVPGAVENGNVHTFTEGTTGSTAATRSRATAQLIPGKEVHRLKLSLALPKAQTVDGIVKVAHITRCNVEFLFPVDGTRDDRRDIKDLMRNFFADATVTPMVADLEDLY